MTAILRLPRGRANILAPIYKKSGVADVGRQISVLLSIALLTLLTACGGGSDSPPPPPPVDTTPNSFSFTNQSGTAFSTVVSSNEIVIAGINATAAVSITGGEYSINGGAFTSAAGTVSNGQTLTVRVTTAGQFSTPMSAVLTVGGVSATFTATTLDADTTPDAYSFPRKSDVTRDSWVESASVAITGINTAAPLTIDNGEYSVAGGAFTSAAGSIDPGQSLVVRTMAGSTYSKATRARVTIGTVSSDFEVTTVLPAYLPDGVAYDGEDVVYLLSNTHHLVFRWSIDEERYLDAFAVGSGALAPTTMAFASVQHRLYLGYESGAIQAIDVNAASPAEAPFATLPAAVTSLGDAGNFLIAQSGTYNYSGGYVLSSSGAVAGQGGYYYGYSRETAWDPATSRLYFTRDGLSPNDLHFDVIDQATGQVTSSGETPYHGAYDIRPPIRLSVDGQYALLGSGDLYSRPDLNWSGSVGSQFVDARWFTNGSLATLMTADNHTTLRRASGLTTLEQLTYTGGALRIVGTDTKMAVLIDDGGALKIHTYVPSDDTDGDGVANTEDAFPLDRAASVDSDRDGHPDAWNSDCSELDSTTGLTLDAFPQDSACWLAEHGSGGICDHDATIPAYVPDQIVHHGDTVYLLSSANKRVYRWSISAAAYLNPFVVGIDQGFETLAPSRMAFASNNQRLYLGYSTGAIRYIDTTGGPAELPFANAAKGVGGLASVGNYLLAQDGSGAWATHYVFDSAGVVTAQTDWNYYSREYAWDPVTSRVYFFRDDTSPNDLHFEVIDQSTGQISSAGETPYHGSYGIEPPIRVSVDGQSVLLGTGDIYAQNGLTWMRTLGTQVADARWFANGSLVTLTTSGNQTSLRRIGASGLVTLEQLSFTGAALRVVGTDAGMVVVVRDNDTVQFHAYVPNDDSDDDGVANTQDAFPLDPAASVDSDHDGYPDAWNAGKTQGDSTTGLVLDAFPTDAGCWLPEHGSGGVCDYNAAIPEYTPDQIAQQGDIVYLLSGSNHRVYRWSLATGEYVSPYVVGVDLGLSTAAPTTMAYSDNHQRLYLGYANGAIRYIDVTSGAAEVTLTTLPAAVISLGSAGNFLAAQSASYGGGVVLDSNGVTTAQGGAYYGYSRETAWDPVTSRLYYTRDSVSPNDLHYDVIDQITGLVTATGETPYHGDFNVFGPIRLSTDGSQILLGSGDIYARSGLTRTSSLGTTIRDAHWKDNLIIDVDNTDLVEIRDADSRAVLQTYQYLGEPLRVLFGQTEAYLVHVMNGTTAFVRLPFYDQDADLMARWWEQHYSLSDSDSADALTDLDSDGVDNQTEFLNFSDPLVADTDADGLTDSQEIVTHQTNPARADSDGDGLSDYAEVMTHLTDPLDADSDDDSYTDLDEVLYGGDPNDSSVLPQPLFSYSQDFENSPDLSAWSAPAQTNAPWVLGTLDPHAGTASLDSGDVANADSSAVRFRGFFRPGLLSFWAKMDSAYCCSRLDVLVDGVSVLSLYGILDWQNYSVALDLGIHEIEWRFQKDSYSGQPGDAARLDDVVFTAQ
jgi:hypothetical protein